jgi:hypothetical protein
VRDAKTGSIDQVQSWIRHEDYHFLGPASRFVHRNFQCDLGALGQDVQFAMVRWLAPSPVCPGEGPDAIHQELATWPWHRHHVVPRPLTQEANQAKAGARLHLNLR